MTNLVVVLVVRGGNGNNNKTEVVVTGRRKVVVVEARNPKRKTDVGRNALHGQKICIEISCLLSSTSD